MGYGSEGVVARQLPSPKGNDIPVAPRFSRYAEALMNNVLQGFDQLNDEGSYFVGTTAVGTPQAFGTNSTAFSDTAGALVIYNKDIVTNPNAKRVYLDFIKLLFTTAPTTVGTPFWQYAMKIDSLLSRYASGATFFTPAPANMDSGAPSISQLGLGNIVLAAASPNARVVDRGCLRGAQPVLNDTIVFNFGGLEKPVGAGSLALATAGSFLINCPPVILGPQHVFSLHQWAAGMGVAGQCEAVVGLFER